ncbi:hypothetical protein [Micromonospora saelicesensis]|uniref:hypothetical protein n=1 Tax=Micromonospora saelicesensis TaxID=285676 RepID=UPI0011BD6AC5|nr:hypothetical protein [Micromonospora saelicesensis]
MPRKPPSPADQALIDYARKQEVVVTNTQLEHWRRVGLLPANTPMRQGFGGSSSQPAYGAADLVTWLGRHARRGQRTHDVALRAFADGHTVPEPTVRAAFLSAVALALPDPVAGGEDAGDLAQDAATRLPGRDATALIPRRIRRIDARIKAAGISFAPAELLSFDKGPALAEPFTPADFQLMATTVALDGSELNGTGMAALVRSMSPAGAAVPGASMLEFPDGVQATELADEAGNTLLPTGDVRAELRRVVEESTLERLRAGWMAAVERRSWALNLCDTVEVELATGTLGDAVLQWMIATAFGPMRMEIQSAVHEKPTPHGTACTAVMLLWQARQLTWLQEVEPDGLYHLFFALLPPYVLRLLGLEPIGIADALEAIATADPA